MIDLNETPLCTIPRVMCWACDNMELLKLQPNESVDLIYSDILYGTGRNFGEYQDLKPKRDVIESHYLPRLIEMKRVLKQSGSIYLQMDTRINHWVRILMDDVFGYDNFLNEIVWCYTGAYNSSEKFPPKHDVILRYKKGKICIFNKDEVRVSYKKDSLRLLNTQKGFNKERTQKYKGKVVEDYWVDIPNGLMFSKEKKPYPTQKPKELIKRIVLASTNEGDVVADYYLGSGTTAEVCKDLNRNFIGCDINPKAIEITKARLNAGTQPCT